VSRAVGNINELIAPALKGKDPTAQVELDRFMVRELDGSENDWGYSKEKLGANAVLAVSIALCKAGAAQKDMPLYKYIAELAGVEETVLPVPAFNVINGGSHAGNKLAIQEFMILPTGAKTFSEAVRMGSEVYHTLKKIIAAKYGMESTSVGDEGGFAPILHESAEGQSTEALDLLVEAIESAGYTGLIEIGIDAAASEFYSGDDETYDLDFKTEGEEKDAAQKKTGEGLRDMYVGFCTSSAGYPIATIEDPFDQDDWENTAEFTARELCQVRALPVRHAMMHVRRVTTGRQCTYGCTWSRRGGLLAFLGLGASCWAWAAAWLCVLLMVGSGWCRWWAMICWSPIRSV
jgi:enolase